MAGLNKHGQVTYCWAYRRAHPCSEEVVGGDDVDQGWDGPAVGLRLRLCGTPPKGLQVNSCIWICIWAKIYIRI